MEQFKSSTMQINRLTLPRKTHTRCIGCSRQAGFYGPRPTRDISLPAATASQGHSRAKYFPPPLSLCLLNLASSFNGHRHLEGPPCGYVEGPTGTDRLAEERKRHTVRHRASGGSGMGSLEIFGSVDGMRRSFCRDL